MDSIYSFFEKHDKTKVTDNGKDTPTVLIPSIHHNDLSILRDFAVSPITSGNIRRNHTTSILPSKHTFDDYLIKKMMENVNRLGKMSQLLFIGDSFFFKFPKAHTKWTTLESKYGAINLGAPGERTEHILNRFQNGHILKNITTKRPMVLAMIGTSNVIVGEQSNSILHGIDAVLTLMTQHLQSPWFVIISILPQSTIPFNQTILEVNQRLALKYQTNKTHKNIEFVDFTNVFQHPNNGSLKQHLYMIDQLHPNREGQDMIMHHLQTFFDHLITLSDVPMIPSRLK